MGNHVSIQEDDYFVACRPSPIVVCLGKPEPASWLGNDADRKSGSSRAAQGWSASTVDRNRFEELALVGLPHIPSKSAADVAGASKYGTTKLKPHAGENGAAPGIGERRKMF